MLLGGCCDAPLASFRLKDILLFTLQKLALYGEKGYREEGYKVISDLPAQLQELIRGGFPFS